MLALPSNSFSPIPPIPPPLLDDATLQISLDRRVSLLLYIPISHQHFSIVFHHYLVLFLCLFVCLFVCLFIYLFSFPMLLINTSPHLPLSCTYGADRIVATLLTHGHYTVQNQSNHSLFWIVFISALLFCFDPLYCSQPYLHIRHHFFKSRQYRTVVTDLTGVTDLTLWIPCPKCSTSCRNCSDCYHHTLIHSHFFSSIY